MSYDGTIFHATGRINRLGILCIDAYGVAVRNGFEGTVEEWLESLKGEDGKTPVKGVDYFTEEDKQEIIAALSGGELNVAALKTFLEENGVGYQQNPVDADNEIWTERMKFGMDTSTAPVPLKVGGQLLVDGTIIGKNSGTKDKNRHGYHVLETYGKDNYSRMTVVMDKHNSEGNNKPSAELYHYTGANHHAGSYGNMKIGSDVKMHSFCFDRDKMTAYGEIDSKMPITLARISLKNDIDITYDTVAAADAAYEPEEFAEENLKCLKYIALKNADDGAMFYDVDRDVPVMKINGKWCDVPSAAIGDSSYNVLNNGGLVVEEAFVFEWTNGTIGPTGDNRVSDQRLRTVGFIPEEIKTIEAAEGYLFTVLFLDENGYNETGAYYRPSTGALDSSAAYVGSVDLTNVSFEGYPNRRLILKREDNAVMSVGEEDCLDYNKSTSTVISVGGYIDDKYLSGNIARKTDIPEVSTGLPIPETAAVGQYIVVSAVDENGVVTATEAVTPDGLPDAEGVAF